MAYVMYIDTTMYPVTPSQITVKIKNQNKSVMLINESEINVIKEAGLTAISFKALLPNSPYPFAMYEAGFVPASSFLAKLEKLKVGKKVFQFILSREMPGGRQLAGTNIKVSLEDYSIEENVNNGLDVMVSVNLKQFRDYGIKTIEIPPPPPAPPTPEPAPSPPPVVIIEEPRPAESAPMVTVYTVVSGDTLWGIAKKYYNNGSDYPRIFEANRDKVSNPNLIFPGQQLIIP